MKQASPAVLGRARRVTAGRRMSSLVGKALEDDNEFWTNSVWKEDKDGEASSDDGSYNVDDELEENCVDVFDSDFNDSESDSDDNHCVNSKVERKVSRSVKSKTIQSARHLLRRKKGKRRNTVGNGDNAGIVLNMPLLPSEVRSVHTHDTTLRSSEMLLQHATPTVHSAGVKVSTTKHESLSNDKHVMSRRNTPCDTFLQRSLRKATKAKTSEAHQNHIVAEKDSQKRARILAETKRKANHKRKFTQEELLVEAVVETEPENEKWILGRKRVQAMSEEKKRIESVKKDSRVAQKYHSRKGCFNTLTFADMDLAPSLLKKDVERKKKCVEYCIITGKKARYRDSLTGEGYYDKEAFKELRRRHKSGESLCRRRKMTNCSTSNGSRRASVDSSISRDTHNLLSSSSVRIEGDTHDLLSPSSVRIEATPHDHLTSCSVRIEGGTHDVLSSSSVQVEALDNTACGKLTKTQIRDGESKKVLRHSDSQKLNPDIMRRVLMKKESQSFSHAERKCHGLGTLLVRKAAPKNEEVLEKVLVENNERRVTNRGQIHGASDCLRTKSMNGTHNSVNVQPKCSRTIEDAYKRSRSVCA